jgi:hypothetical protein
MEALRLEAKGTPVGPLITVLLMRQCGVEAVTDIAITELEPWEYSAPARLQYWPVHINPTNSGVWDHPKAFETLREAVAWAITEPEPSFNVAWIMTSGGRILKSHDIEDLWLRFKADETVRP